ATLPDRGARFLVLSFQTSLAGQTYIHLSAGRSARQFGGNISLPSRCSRCSLSSGGRERMSAVRLRRHSFFSVYFFPRSVSSTSTPSFILSSRTTSNI